MTVISAAPRGETGHGPATSSRHRRLPAGTRHREGTAARGGAGGGAGAGLWGGGGALGRPRAQFRPRSGAVPHRRLPSRGPTPPISRRRHGHALDLSQPLDPARLSGSPIGQRPRRMLRHAAAGRRRGKMAAPEEPGQAAFARRIDPAREPGLSPEQRRLMAQVEFAQRQRVLQRRLRNRNVLLALGIGAVTLGICILQGRGRAGPGVSGAAPAAFP